MRIGRTGADGGTRRTAYYTMALRLYGIIPAKWMGYTDASLLWAKSGGNTDPIGTKYKKGQAVQGRA